jgi:hypothetical protein
MKKSNIFIFLSFLIPLSLFGEDLLKAPPPLEKKEKFHFEKVPFDHTLQNEDNQRRAPDENHFYIVPPSDELLFLKEKPTFLQNN